MEKSNSYPLLHILVVNFHHKRGSQIEFVYPPFEYGGKENVPSAWKHLPTFCLPDGAHNVSQDTVFFNLPDIKNPKKSVYGVSCYRQIAVEDLKVITEDITRSSVQRSVCAVLSLPIFGYIEVKLSLLADAYFIDQKDSDILVKAFHQLNTCMINGDIGGPLQHLYVGLNIREIFLKWRHKLLILYKLFLLQKRVIFFGSPVRPTCELICGIISLYPDLLSKGFDEVFCVKTSRPISPMPSFSSEFSVGDPVRSVHEIESSILERKTSITNNNEGSGNTTQLQREASMDTLYSTIGPFRAIKPEQWSAPVPIFQNGNLLCPYLSLPYMDLLQDPSVHSYVIGASNILFKQKRQLADVFVETESGKIELNDPNMGDLELRKLLELSTEDRRFIDYLLKHILNPREGAEGSENWLREQFHWYLVALLRTSVCCAGSKEIDQFNGHFMTIFRRTEAYDEWSSVRIDTEEFTNLPPGHPFSGNLSVVDMKLRISQSMHNSESGRKINNAVNQTTKAVGGALASAKSTFTSLWNSISTTAGAATNASEDDEEKINISEDISKRGQIESCVEALVAEEFVQESTDTKRNTKRDVIERQRKESTKEELEEMIQKTADKIIEYADFENRKGKVFTV